MTPPYGNDRRSPNYVKKNHRKGKAIIFLYKPPQTNPPTGNDEWRKNLLLNNSVMFVRWSASTMLISPIVSTESTRKSTDIWLPTVVGSGKRTQSNHLSITTNTPTTSQKLWRRIRWWSATVIKHSIRTALMKMLMRFLRLFVGTVKTGIFDLCG